MNFSYTLLLQTAFGVKEHSNEILNSRCTATDKLNSLISYFSILNCTDGVGDISRFSLF